MSNGRERLLDDVRALLGRVIAAAAGLDLADRAFAAWLLGPGRCPFDLPTLISASVGQRGRGYREVAALGYAAEVTSPACQFRPELCEALGWLSKRPTTMCGEVAGFVSDPVALLGIALGASRCGQPTIEADVAAWVARVFAARAAIPDLEPWESCLLAAAAHRSHRPGLAATPTGADTADCRIVLRARAVLPPTHPADANADEAALVALLLEDHAGSLGFARAVTRAAAYDVLKSEVVASGKVGVVNEGSTGMTTEPHTEQAKKVFVSYSWEEGDPGHQQEVLRFTNQVRQYGFDATMDLFHPNPPEGFPLWMLNQIRRADFVLMVITETYRRRCEDDEEPGKGKGVKWEGGIVTRSLYQAEFRNGKFIPVVFGPKHISSIPTILSGNTYYDVRKPERFEDLVRFMSGQLAYVPAPIGRVPHLPPRSDGSGS
ncbi:MAG: TIR domain-containing protein [Gemmataceae bacterium]|nr:TIR domain-containing protein [Gemmataceae bacterium]